MHLHFIPTLGMAIEFMSLKYFRLFPYTSSYQVKDNSANSMFYSTLPCVSPGTDLSCTQAFCLVGFDGFANKCLQKSCLEEDLYCSARFFFYKHS